MSYSLLEASSDSGAPVELYTFTLRDKTWRFTPSKDSYLDSKNYTFKSVLIRRSGIKRSNSIDRAKITIEVEASNELAGLFKLGIPTFDLRVMIQRTHRGADDAIIIYQGYVVGCDFDNNKATLTIEPLTGLLTNNALTQTYKRICNNRVYDHNCGLNIDDYSEPAYIFEINKGGTELSVYGDFWDNLVQLGTPNVHSYYQDGLVLFNNEYKQIVLNETKGIIHILSPFEGLAVDDEITLIRGCQRTMSSCQAFNNSDNFAGYPHIPLRNIFQSGL